MLKKILLGLVVVIGGLAAFIATRPDATHVERSTTIAAAPDVIFGYVDDFHRWADWSPWDKLDPDQKKTFEGPASGVGAMTAWEGNDKVGKGRMTILDSKPGAFVKIKLEFIEPWAQTNETTFTLSPDGSGTRVVWASDFNNGFVGKAFGLFMDMDAMIGADFETGLANMKKAAEGGAPAAMPVPAPPPVAMPVPVPTPAAMPDAAAPTAEADVGAAQP